MAENDKDPWLNYLALTTVILAVCATLATFKGGGYSTRAVLSQAQATDQWNYFQAKGIKAYLYELQKDKIELELTTLQGRDHQPAADAFRRKADDYATKIKKYDTEKADIMKEAKRQEAIRDDAQLHSRKFGIAVIFLQIAILLSSIAALLKKRYLWLTGITVGMGGIVYFVDGFLLFM